MKAKEAVIAEESGRIPRGNVVEKTSLNYIFTSEVNQRYRCGS